MKAETKKLTPPEKIGKIPSLRSLCLKIDRDVWAKVESGKGTASWGREQTGLLILEFLKEYDQTYKDGLRKEIDGEIIIGPRNDYDTGWNTAIDKLKLLLDKPQD
jgi:hypothetical protein